MERLTEHEAQQRFENWLDETHEEITLLGMTYAPSYVLKECDPIAYRVTFHDWLDYENSEGLIWVEGFHVEEDWNGSEED